ncbi:HlyD family efflux transporter periplasmic adaptor subunit [Streptosporangium amethystogenes]|uniref:HlyD family efflux transporter periplasmic adaptor subunit n=1 Tax=Streptosporangium amethystogenes TaxID=2002 RepID=UPI00068F3AAD|nr:HlyD family efflux transporter periplasmic adaptor subunit [Streptosporangium amethystogenes]
MRFRYQALQRMREPDELDSPTLLATPRGWIAVFVVMIVMAGGLVWAFVGELRISVAAPGVLTHPGGTARIQSHYSGLARRVLVRPGDRVIVGQSIAELQDADGKTQEVASPFTGQVVGTTVSDGQVVAVGTTVATVERTDLPDDRLVAMVFVPADRAAWIAPGRPVDLEVSTAPAAAFGLLRGQVTSVSRYPLTGEALAGLVGGELAARRYAAVQAPLMIIVDLIPDQASHSGYTWSTAQGPPVQLDSQVTVSASIHLGEQTPFDLVLGR